jgi:hypothetical protein
VEFLRNFGNRLLEPEFNQWNHFHFPSVFDLVENASY